MLNIRSKPLKWKIIIIEKKYRNFLKNYQAREIPMIIEAFFNLLNFQKQKIKN